MKVFHIDQFKCTLCSNWFCPPFNLPYRLKCTHSICSNCLQKSISNNTNQIICPQDLQRNMISQIAINQSTKKALQRLLKQHKNFTQTNHLQCIKSLSLNFDQMLDSKQIQLKNLSTLIDQIFQNQIKRLRQIYQKIKIQINRPFRIVNDWKDVVKNYLKKVKTMGPNVKGCVNQLNHYIEQGRKIKLDLNQYLNYNFKDLIDLLIVEPEVCFTHKFSIFNEVEKQISKQRSERTLNKNINKKGYSNNISNTSNNREVYNFIHGQRQNKSGFNNNNQRQIILDDVTTTNFDQSSIKENRKDNHYYYAQEESNKVSLFEELIQETPKNGGKMARNMNNKNGQNSGQYVLNGSKNVKRQSPLKQLFKMKSSNKSNNNLLLSNQKNDQQFILKTYNKRQAFQESNNENYNSQIKQKINKLVHQSKNKQNCYNATKTMGKSLQYSPDSIAKAKNMLDSLKGGYDGVVERDGQIQWNRNGLLRENKNCLNATKKLSFQNNKRVQRNRTDYRKNPTENQQSYEQCEQDEHVYSYNKSSNRYEKQPSSATNPKSRNQFRQQNQLFIDQQMLLDQRSNRKEEYPPLSYNTKIKTKTEQSTNKQLRKNSWQLENINFLKQWKLNKNQRQQEQLEIIQKYGGYDCEKQKNKYIKKIEENKVRELLKETIIGENYIQLVGHSLADLNICLFLDQINWNYRNVEIVKFIKTSLCDQQLNQLLNYLVRSNIHTLMLSYNNLTQLSLDALLNFIQVNNKLKNIYLPKNNISLLKGNARGKISLLKEKGINLYI